MRLPKIYPITDRKLSGLSHSEQVARLIDGGATVIQLREKYLSPNEFLREAKAAGKVAAASHVTLIINDRLDIAMAVGAGGVHLGQEDLPVNAARSLVSETMMIGFSTHSLKQIEEAARTAVDYLAFGPVFPTSSKTDHEPTVGLDQLRAAKIIAAQLPLVAIGGITQANATAVLDAGADSLAVISAVLHEKARIAENMRRMLDLAGD